jgi:hypothetical protein
LGGGKDEAEIVDDVAERLAELNMFKKSNKFKK